MRKALLLVCLILAFSVQADRHHPSNHPSIPFTLKAATDWQSLTNGNFSSAGHVFFSLPSGTITDRQVISQGGMMVTRSVAVLGRDFPGLLSQIWYGKTEDLPTGVNTFRLILTLPDGRQFTIDGLVPIRVTSDKVGPLKDVVTDANGGVQLVGDFPTPPVVVAPNWLNSVVPVDPSNYIEPGVMGPLPTDVTVCSTKDGDPNHIECGTKTAQPFKSTN